MSIPGAPPPRPGTTGYSPCWACPAGRWSAESPRRRPSRPGKARPCPARARANQPEQIHHPVPDHGGSNLVAWPGCHDCRHCPPALGLFVSWHGRQSFPGLHCLLDRANTSPARGFRERQMARRQSRLREPALKMFRFAAGPADRETRRGIADRPHDGQGRGCTSASAF